MSQLFDSLRRQDRTKPMRSGPSPSVKGDAVLATLGYTPVRPGVRPRVVVTIALLALVAIGWYVWATFRGERIQQFAQRPPSRSASVPPSPVVATATPATPRSEAPNPLSSTPAVAKPDRPTPVPVSPPAASPPAATPPASPKPVSHVGSEIPPSARAALASPAVDHWTQALYYQKDGDFDNALRHYTALLEKEPMNAQVRNNLGMLYQQRGTLDQAVREFQRALHIDPRYARAHNNLGVAYLAQQNVDAAAAQFRAALDIDRRNVDAMVNLALADKALGQPERAKEGLLRALGLDPRSAAAHYNLGVLHDETGEAALAMQHYHSFLENASADYARRAVEVRARLDTLGRTR